LVSPPAQGPIQAGPAIYKVKRSKYILRRKTFT